MPEFVEVEAYRRTAEPLSGSRIDAVQVRDDRMLRRGDEAARVYGIVGGAVIDGLRRIGKVLLFDLSTGHTMALTFGLRGRLIVNGEMARTDGSRRRVSPERRHVRLSLEAGGGELELEDQLRLATLEIDLDESRLGVDVLKLEKAALPKLIQDSSAALKSLLMDQSRIAGIGNLVADEVLFQAKLDPRRAAKGLSPAEIDDLWTGLRRTRTRLLERGGSHRGILIQSGARKRDGRCPRCDAEIRRIKVGGRTTYFCTVHQH